MRNRLLIRQSRTAVYIGTMLILLSGVLTLCFRNTGGGWIACGLIAVGIAFFTILPYFVGGKDYMILDREGMEVAEWHRKIRWEKVASCTYQRELSSVATHTAVHKMLVVTLLDGSLYKTDMGLYACSDRRLMDEIDGWSGRNLFDRHADKTDRKNLGISLLLAAVGLIALLILLSFLLYGRL